MEKDPKDILTEAKERFGNCQDFWSPIYSECLADLRFSLGDQWDETTRRNRENDKDGARPCLTVDKLEQYVRQVTNDARQNKPAPKARPIHDSDEDVADLVSGLFRHISNNSRADIAYDTASEFAVRSGFGWIRICTDYADEESFEQEILIKAVRNPFSVYIDPDFQSINGSDADYAFVFENVPRKTFERQYPDADVVSFDDPDHVAQGWTSENHVRVAEYWAVEYDVAIIDPPEGSSAQPRKVYKRRVVWRKITATEILDERTWPTQYIGIVPVWGRIIDEAGTLRVRSLIRPAIDAQRMYNYAASSAVERVSLAPKAKYLAAAEAIEGHESEWGRAHISNNPVLPWNHTVDGQPVPPPQYMGGAEVPSGWVNLMQAHEHDIQAALGMYNASLGAPSNEKSGKAILARQREADTSTFDFVDNLSRAIEQVWRVVLGLLPTIYDTPRILRIIGEDGSGETATLDPRLEQPIIEQQDPETGAIQKLFNPFIGKYDVEVTVGPAYATKRQETAEWLTQVTQGNPQMLQIVGDLMFKALDMPMADEVAKRFKAMLPPQIQQAEAEGQKEKIPQAVQAQMGQMQQALQQSMQIIQKLQADLQQAKSEEDVTRADFMLKAQSAKLEEMQVQIKQAELELKAREVQIKEYEAETERLQLVTTNQEAFKSDEEKAQEQMQESAESEQEAAQSAMQMQMLAQLSDGVAQASNVLAAVAEKINAPKVVSITAPSGRVFTVATDGEHVQIDSPSGVYTGEIEDGRPE